MTLIHCIQVFGICVILVYWCRFLLHWTKLDNKQTLQTCISRAFVAIATSSGGIQILIDTSISLGEFIITMKSESGESEVWTLTYILYMCCHQTTRIKYLNVSCLINISVRI